MSDASKVDLVHCSYSLLTGRCCISRLRAWMLPPCSFHTSRSTKRSSNAEELIVHTGESTVCHVTTLSDVESGLFLAVPFCA